MIQTVFLWWALEESGCRDCEEFGFCKPDRRTGEEESPYCDGGMYYDVMCVTESERAFLEAQYQTELAALYQINGVSTPCVYNFTSTHECIENFTLDRRRK